jgi:hypothetical protein
LINAYQGIRCAKQQSVKPRLDEAAPLVLLNRQINRTKRAGKDSVVLAEDDSIILYLHHNLLLIEITIYNSSTSIHLKFHPRTFPRNQRLQLSIHSIPNNANLTMPPKAIYPKQCSSDLKAPLGCLLIENSIPHSQCLNLLFAPYNRNNRDTRAMSGSHHRRGCGGWDGRGSNSVSPTLLSLRKHKSVVQSVCVEDRDGFDVAVPRIRDLQCREQGIGIHHQISILDKGSRGSGSNVFIGEKGAENGDSSGGCSSGSGGFRYRRR